MEYHFSAKKGSVTTGVKRGFIVLSVLLLLSGYFYLGENRFVRIDAFRTCTMTAGQTLDIPVRLDNRTRFGYRSVDGYFLSGRMIVPWSITPLDLPRTTIELEPRRLTIAMLRIIAPKIPGEYLITIDIVKEGEFWLASRGNRPRILRLRVGD
jgi:hypothetical protein